MGGSFFPWLSSSKKAKKKMAKTLAKVAKVSSKSLPVVRTVQGIHGIAKLGNVVNNVNEATGNLSVFLSKASNVADSVDQFIPEMQVMGQSLCDSARLFTYFTVAATIVGIGANLVLTYQGNQVLQLIAERLQDISKALAAQTALIAQKDFSQYVHDMIRERVGVTSHDPDRDHWFFVYHPDNDWYPKFYHLVSDTPLGDRFCGYTNQIDTVFLFMLEARQRIEEEDRARIRQQPIRPVKLHLLIPAYQPILIAEALKIPENIGDFVIEGRINSGVEFVWLNLPREQRHYVEGIGEWIPPTPGWWDWCMSKLGLADEMPMLGEARVLGTRQQVQGGDSDQDVDDSLGGGSDGDDNSSVVVQYESDGERDRHDATPLHQRRRRRHRRHRHRTSEDGRASRREGESTLADFLRGRPQRRRSRG